MSNIEAEYHVQGFDHPFDTYEEAAVEAECYARAVSHPVTVYRTTKEAVATFQRHMTIEVTHP